MVTLCDKANVDNIIVKNDPAVGIKRGTFLLINSEYYKQNKKR